MCEKTWYKTFVLSFEGEIINKWLQEIDNKYPGLYNLTDLRNNGKIYYRLLTDIWTPIEQHDVFEIIPKMCIYHAEKNTPIHHLLDSSHMWRKTLLNHLWEYFDEMNIPTEDIKKINITINCRIDAMQNMICKTYLDYTQQIIQSKNETINNLHNDRLNMLGKMAASMAHEIRNPLTAIDGFIQLIRSEIPPESKKEISRYLEIIDNEFEKIYMQITIFLSFSKNNGVEEPFIICNSDDLIKTAMNIVEPRCINEQVELSYSLENSFDISIQKIAFQQVLTNLINNSIDALQETVYPKKITITSFEDERNTYISIEDNGPGIPKEIRETIFEPFSTSKEFGTGLGLAVCKQIMNKNKSNISYISKQGETIFTLSFKKEL